MSTITVEEAAELYEASDGEIVGSWIKVGGVDPTYYSRQSRWHDRYWLVVCDGDGLTWGVEYGIGLTEDQENDLPWDDMPAGAALTLERLYARTVIKTEYRTEPAAASPVDS